MTSHHDGQSRRNRPRWPGHTAQTSSDSQVAVAGRGQRELGQAMILTAAVMVVEWAAGWFSGSLALMADAGHMLADASALGLSLFAAWISSRPATVEKTYGYYRTEILAALGNGVALWLIVICIFISAMRRLVDPQPVRTAPMLAVACLGLAVNLANARILFHASSMSLNVRGAWLNVLSDAIGSFGVIVAGALIWAFGWTVADPLASLVIGVLIGLTSWGLIRQSVNILLEGTPGHVRIPEVIDAIRQIPGVQDVHDVHLWTITTGMDSMSGHVTIQDIARSEAILSELQQRLSLQFGMTHTTFQLEPYGHHCGSLAHP